MYRRALIPLILVLAAAVLMAGCTGTTPGPGPTPTPGVTETQTTAPPHPTTTAVPSGDCIQPSPTVTIDPRFVVQVDVIRDPVSLNKKITVIFQGGKGQFLTQRVDAKITREDCSTETKSITRPESGSIVAGSSVNFNGSNRDRMEITVTINGVPSKIIDQVYQFQTRP
jgi:predicted small secreted protein